MVIYTKNKKIKGRLIITEWLANDWEGSITLSRSKRKKESVSVAESRCKREIKRQPKTKKGTSRVILSWGV